VVVHDCGTVINPLILPARFTAASRRASVMPFYEKLSFDDQGQLLNASLADYPIADGGWRYAHGTGAYP